MSLTRERLQQLQKVGRNIGVVIRWGNGAQQRVREAKILEVVRAAARLRFEDGNEEERTIHFKHLKELPEPAGGASAFKAAPASAPAPRPVLVTAPPPTVASAKRDPEPAKPAPAPPTKTAPAKSVIESPAPPSTPTDEIEAWLQMGREMLDPIESEIATWAMHKEGLEAERNAIDEELEGLVPRLKELHAKRERIARGMSAFRSVEPVAAAKGKI